jgi:DNA-binding HxlR family transcriptional regulator
MPATPDLDLLRDALATSTLSHGLKVFGDRWTAEVVLGSFLGVRRFEEWLARSRIPRPTLADRLRTLVQLGVLQTRLYQERPERHAYHLTRKGAAMYDSVLMIWDWERRWGDRKGELPGALVHGRCGHRFRPLLTCLDCGDAVGMTDLRFSLEPNPRLPPETPSGARTPRIPASGGGMSLGLRVDRWTLMIVAAVILGCHYFDQLSKVLRIVPSVLARRLAAMLEGDLLQAQTDRDDARRRIYRLTPRSRDLLGYMVCLTRWASAEHFHEPPAINTEHIACGHRFVPRVACDQCHQPLQPWEVSADVESRAAAPAGSRP